MSPTLVTGEDTADRGAGASVDGVTSDGRPVPAPPAKGATQATAPPPFVPEQLQVHGPLPLTALLIPAAQRPLLGVVRVGTPVALPQIPVMGAGGCRSAVQLTVMPPLAPMQLQFQGP